MDIMLKNILFLIESKYQSDTDFEKDFGLARSTVSAWRKGKLKSYRKKQAELAKFFGVSADWLAGNEQTEKPTTQSNEPADLKNILENVHGLMFNGEPLTDDDRKQILKVIQALQDK